MGASIESSIDDMTAAWNGYRSSTTPPLLAAQMDDALEALGVGTVERDPAAVRQGAVDVAYAGLDLELQYRSPAEVDLDRMDRWVRQLLVDVETDDAGAVAGDVVSLTAIWDRTSHTVASVATGRIDVALLALQQAADAEDLVAALNAAMSLQAAIVAIV